MKPTLLIAGLMTALFVLGCASGPHSKPELVDAKYYEIDQTKTIHTGDKIVSAALQIGKTTKNGKTSYQPMPETTMTELIYMGLEDGKIMILKRYYKYDDNNGKPKLSLTDTATRTHNPEDKYYQCQNIRIEIIEATEQTLTFKVISD